MLLSLIFVGSNEIKVSFPNENKTIFGCSALTFSSSTVLANYTRYLALYKKKKKKNHWCLPLFKL